MKWRYVFTSMILAVVTSPVISGETDHAGCNNDVTVYVDKLGIVNEKKLQESIDSAQSALNQIHGMNTRSRERRLLLRDHLVKMQQIMKEMHNLKLTGDCAAAAHGASLETRINVLEKRMDMIQDMFGQMIENQSGEEKE